MGIIESKLLRFRIRFKPKQYGGLVPVDEYYGDHFGLLNAYSDEDTYEDARVRGVSTLSCYEEDDSDSDRAPRPIYTPIPIQADTSRIWER